MKFTIEKSLEILQRTPDVLRTLLSDLDEGWTENNEGGETWSPHDVVGHLVHAEKLYWISRAKLILSDAANKTFENFDFENLEESKSKNLSQLLDEFSRLRKENIKILKSLEINTEQLKMEGIHPNFGKAKLSQLLSTWTVHDLVHLAQISRVMAKQYKEEIGPWIEYFRIFKG
jgi:uncharacterized damage-inducible protein DinB